MAAPADPTDVIARRVAANIIDTAIIVGPAIALAASSLEYLEEDDMPPSRSASDFCDDYLDSYEENICVPVMDRAYFGEPTEGPILTAFGLTILLYVLIQGLTGWTVGKVILGIRTVRADGRPAGIGRAALRTLLWIIDGLPVLGLVGFITALTTTGHRRVGDMVAKTFVVRAAAAGRPVVVPGFTAPGAMPPPPAATGPQWDEGRGTYIQWDPAELAWMQWDDGSKTWKAIPGQPGLPPPPPLSPPPE